MDGERPSEERLTELARGLKDLYGERYRGLVLYGSYARGEADEGSDVDVLLLPEGSVAIGRVIVRMEPVVWPISLEAGYAISVLPVSVRAYLEPKEPLLTNNLKEGVPVTRARFRPFFKGRRIVRCLEDVVEWRGHGIRSFENLSWLFSTQPKPSCSTRVVAFRATAKSSLSMVVYSQKLAS